MRNAVANFTGNPIGNGLQAYYETYVPPPPPPPQERVKAGFLGLQEQMPAQGAR